jgi:hypothetical protein
MYGQVEGRELFGYFLEAARLAGDLLRSTRLPPYTFSLCWEELANFASASAFTCHTTERIKY